jgi:hypothetical protein
MFATAPGLTFHLESDPVGKDLGLGLPHKPAFLHAVPEKSAFKTHS